MSDRPTKKQQELLQFIGDFIKEHGYGPSYREIMRGLNYKSVSTVAVHVDGLIARGWLRKRTHSARSLEITSPNEVAVPNTTNAGVEAAATTDIEKVLTQKCDELLAADEPMMADVTALIEVLRILGYNKSYERYNQKRNQITANHV